MPTGSRSGRATQLTAEVLQNQARLKAIVRAGVGVDNIDVPAATRQGIVVMNTPGGNTVSTAEHTMALMLALARNVAVANDSLKSGKWDRNAFTGTQLEGKTLGVVGLGRVGLAVAQARPAVRHDRGRFRPAAVGREGARERDRERVAARRTLAPLRLYLAAHAAQRRDTHTYRRPRDRHDEAFGANHQLCAGGLIDEAALVEAHSPAAS